ncbi:hypothetical protein N7468_008119 [Penicillium chermesinum]|uniref:Uncharacterized protein n=1 Tax=Penicillium chermesinum TaxID=63820 RepID=A0A9W9THZ8_9EURO|nr:uncharacterized protein N7468_008119 [Penicillium chermesinum]KAJ5223577.1 hypothetical protein N7468_008119 [Penicillium chermesinum]
MESDSFGMKNPSPEAFVMDVQKQDPERDEDDTHRQKGGQLKGRNGLLRQRNRRWMFLNTTASDIHVYYYGSAQGTTSPHYPRRTTCLVRGLSSIPVHNQRLEYDPTLMTYFEHTICSSSTLVDNAHYNPYRYLILPMALESEGLYHATLAIAANTLRLSNSRYRLPALEHHNHALTYLRMLLTRERWDEKELDEMLGLVLMLCWFDISDYSRPSWVTHLSGFQDLINTRRERPGRSIHSQELASFFNRYFMFHLVLARTAFRVDNSTSTSSKTFVSENVLGSPHVIDPYMGFSHSLLSLIHRTTELAWTETETKSNPDPQDVLRLREELENLEQSVPAEFMDPDTECMAIAEANRLGALILLHETCSPRPGSKGQGLPILDSRAKDTYVDLILGLIISKKANMMRTAVLPLWPLFLAGCCSSTEDQRLAVLQIFEELEGIRRFGNITPAMEVVQMVWRQKDLSAQDERKGKQALSTSEERETGHEPRFPWEHAMSILGGWKLSLT